MDKAKAPREAAITIDVLYEKPNKEKVVPEHRKILKI
jgi:hypothetical protein